MKSQNIRYISPPGAPSYIALIASSAGSMKAGSSVATTVEYSLVAHEGSLLTVIDVLIVKSIQKLVYIWKGGSV